MEDKHNKSISFQLFTNLILVCHKAKLMRYPVKIKLTNCVNWFARKTCESMHYGRNSRYVWLQVQRTLSTSIEKKIYCHVSKMVYTVMCFTDILCLFFTVNWWGSINQTIVVINNYVNHSNTFHQQKCRTKKW